MAALVAQPVAFSKASTWKQCTCCPYGYHIDLDFVRFCENVKNSQLLPVAKGHPRRPVRRTSMEVLLGLPSIASVGVETRPMSPMGGDGLAQAVKDFELTLQRASGSTKSYSQLLGEGEMKKDWMDHLKSGSVWRKRSQRKVSPWRESEHEDESQQTSLSPNNTLSLPPTTLHNIRDQMATSLEEIKRLEEEVKQIPILQVELSKLTETNIHLSQKLQMLEKDDKKKDVGSQYIMDRPQMRSIAVGTSVMTRDIGVGTSLPLTVSVGVMTDEWHPPLPHPHPKEASSAKETRTIETQTDKFYEVNLTTQSTQTELKMDAVYSTSDLEKSKEKAIKAYEKAHYDLLHPRKKMLLDKTVQVEEKYPEIQMRDCGTQSNPNTTNSGAMVKPKTLNSICQTVKQTRDVGVSVDIIPKSCSRCNVKKISVGTNTPTGEMKFMSVFGRSKSFDTRERTRKSYRSTSVGPDKCLTSSKSTDTKDLNQTASVAVNTDQSAMVDATTETLNLPKSISKAVVSKIPRPVTLALPKKVLMRQDTYNIPSSKYSSFDNESNPEDSINDDDLYSSLFKSTSQTDIAEALFQPVTSPRTKKEISKEMKGALKVLNDSIKDLNVKLSHQANTAESIVLHEWFKISSVENADPLEVEDYLDFFEEFSSELLQYVVNMVDARGNTAMHYAVSYGNFDVVSVLLDSKVCDVNKRNSAGYTCVMLVSIAEVKSLTDRQVVRRLFNLADVNIRALKYGQTALMLAVSHGRIDMVELLLDSGADINIQDDDGCTAFMCVAENGHTDITKLLLAQPDYDLTITDNDGNTALTIAVEAGNKEIGVLLYARQHFPRGSSPYTSFKSKKPSNVTSVGTHTVSPTPTQTDKINN